MQIWALPANLTCIYISVFGRSPSNDFHAVFSVSPLYYSEKIRCICSVHDLVLWYADAQPRLSHGISVATALTNTVTMYSLLSEHRSDWNWDLVQKAKYCNQSTDCVSTELRLCCVRCRERKREAHASIQKRIPESRRMAGMAGGNRRCFKVPIFADAVWVKRRGRRCSEPGWHSGNPCVTIWMPCDFPVYTQPVSMKWQSDRIVPRRPWPLESWPLIPAGICGVRPLQNPSSAAAFRLGWPLA